MRTYQQLRMYKQLELINDSEGCRRSLAVSVRFGLARFWQWFCLKLTVTSEPQVWESVDASGQMVWHVYDPVSDRSWQFSSAQAVTAWLEERHRQSRQADWQW